MGCTTGIVKTIVFIFNLACAIVGTVLITVGSLFYASISKVDEVSKGNFIVAPSLVIAVGVVVFIISFLGCCGVCQKSSCMLITYAAILLLLLIVQLVAGVYGFIQVKDNDEFKTDFANSLQKSLNEYNKEEAVRDVWDSLQNTLKCCGVDGPQDYRVILRPPTLPKSCCSTNSDCTEVNPNAYKDGCYKIFYDTVTNGVKIVSYVALGIAGVELLGAIFAIFLVITMKNEGRRGGYA